MRHSTKCMFLAAIITFVSTANLANTQKSDLVTLSSINQKLIYNLETLTFDIESLQKPSVDAEQSQIHSEVLIKDKKGSIKSDKNDGIWLRNGQSQIEIVNHFKHRIIIPSSALKLIDHKISDHTDCLGKAQELKIKLRDAENRYELIQLFRSYDNLSMIVTKNTFTNIGKEPVYIEKLTPLYVPSGRDNIVLGTSGAVSWSWYTHGYGHGYEYGARTIDLIDHYNINETPGRWPANPLHSWWYTIFGQAGTNEYALIGAITVRDQPFQISLKPDGLGFNNSVQLQAFCDFNNHRLNSGKSVDSIEIGMVKVFTRPWPALRNYAAALAKRMKIKIRHDSPSVIWSSWYVPGLGSGITEKKILDQANVIAKNRNVWPIDIVHMDYGWSESFNDPKWGNWQADPNKFPNGMKYVADELKALGFKAGIWARPVVLNKGSIAAKESPQMLIDPWTKRHGPYGDYMLDPAHPDSEKFLTKLFEKITKDWGYEYLKIELLVDEWREPYKKIRQTVSDDTIILACFNYGSALGAVDYQRITNDVHYTWKYPQANARWLAGPIGLGRSAKSSILQYHENKKLWWIDPDGISLFKDPRSRWLNKHPYAEVDYEMQFYATIIGMAGGVVTCYGDFLDLPPQTDNLLSVLVPSSTITADVMDFFNKPAPNYLKLTIDRPFEKWHVVSVLNWDDDPKAFQLDSSFLELDTDKQYHVFDFWNWRYLGKLTDKLTLPEQLGHQALVLAVREAKNNLQLLSTSCHITQGAVELADVETTSDTYKATISRPYGKQETKLIFYVPAGQTLVCKIGEQDCSVEKLSPNVWQTTLKYTDQATFIAEVK